MDIKRWAALKTPKTIISSLYSSFTNENLKNVIKFDMHALVGCLEVCGPDKKIENVDWVDSALSMVVFVRIIKVVLDHG